MVGAGPVLVTACIMAKFGNNFFTSTGREIQSIGLGQLVPVRWDGKRTIFFCPQKFIFCPQPIFYPIFSQ